VAGVVGIGVGLAGLGSEPTYVLGGGIFGVLVGTALLSPVLGRPVLSGLGWLYRRGFGAVGLMAEQNARRNPRRTGATASALMIGVALVTMMAVLGASAKASLDKTLAEDIVADFVVSNAVGQSFSATIASDVAGLPGVAEVARVRGALLEIDGDRDFASGVEPGPVSSVARPDVVTGSLDDLDADSLAVSTELATAEGLAVGSTVTVGYAGEERPLRVVATYTEDAVLQSDATLSLEGFDALGVPPTDRTVYVVAAPGTDRSALRADLDALVADLPTVSVNDQAEFAATQREPIDQLLFIVYALLGLAVVIAVLGIVNTLALSVIERVREIGLLRAVGLSRRQLRTMLRLESVAIALLGAVLGIVLGLAFALALQRSLVDDGIDVLAVPGGQLALFVVVAALVGVLAAVWPGRRAARLDVLRAIGTE
jgi:putative ABC transport system permease protein